MIKTQHAIGALVGSAVGDALGAPFEFQRPGLYRSTYPAPVLGGIGEMRGGGGFKWKPGEFTDDTQMAHAWLHDSWPRIDRANERFVEALQSKSLPYSS